MHYATRARSPLRRKHQGARVGELPDTDSSPRRCRATHRARVDRDGSRRPHSRERRRRRPRSRLRPSARATRRLSSETSAVRAVGRQLAVIGADGARQRETFTLLTADNGRHAIESRGAHELDQWIVRRPEQAESTLALRAGERIEIHGQHEGRQPSTGFVFGDHRRGPSFAADSGQRPRAKHAGEKVEGGSRLNLSLISPRLIQRRQG